MADAHESLALLLKENEVVAVVDEDDFWRTRVAKGIRAHQVTVLERARIEETELIEAATVGAIIFGIRELTSLSDVEPVCQMAVKKRVPLVIMPATGVPFDLEVDILRKYNIDTKGIAVDIISAKDTIKAYAALGEGLFAMTEGVEESDSYRRSRIRGV